MPAPGLGERLKGLREGRVPHLSRKRLGEALGYLGRSAEQTIYEWETGRRQLPASEVPRIAELLGVTICDLYGVDEGHVVVIDDLDRVDLTKARDLVQAAVALANAGGGTIIIGTAGSGKSAAMFEPTPADWDTKQLLQRWPTLSDQERQDWLAFAEAITAENHTEGGLDDG